MKARAACRWTALVALGCVVLAAGPYGGKAAAAAPPLRVQDDAGRVAPGPAPGRLANTLSEIGPMLSRCLQLPGEEFARPGMRITVRLAFTRDGAILGEPRFTFTTPGVASEVKAAYQRAVADMLDRCTPLPITKGLGGAIAGRPFAFAIVNTRKEKKVENPRDIQT